MAINSEIFIHESDRAALQALKAIPGFTQVLKAFMGMWNEKQYKIINMSSKVRLSEKQAKKYHDMLIPICETLGIDVPELYIELNPVPNAYTSGENSPFIVLTSGLIETVPEELIPSVIAHECGHIACHHVLYLTMGRMILSGMLFGPALLFTVPLKMAFAYWMRCSEYSADRAAMICDGTADNMIDVCMSLAGYVKEISDKANRDAFIDQAIEYKEMMNSSMWNKTLEFLMYNQMSHPLTAVRAYECREWSKTDRFTKTVEYIANQKGSIANNNICLEKNMSSYINENYKVVRDELTYKGFTNIVLKRTTSRGMFTTNGQVIAFSINGVKDGTIGDWFAATDEVVIEYYEAETEEEQKASHIGQVKVPNSSIYYTTKQYADAEAELLAAGFKTIHFERLADLKYGFLNREGSVAKINIDGVERFDKGTWFKEDAVVTIFYHVFITEAN